MTTVSPSHLHHFKGFCSSPSIILVFVYMKFKFALGYRDLGDTIDFLLRAKRDGVAGKAFLKKTIKNNERPEKVTLDKSESNKCALDYFNKGISTEDKIEIRQIKYLNIIIEQDHRFIKKRVRSMLGFKNFFSAKRTSAGIESVRTIHKGHIGGCDEPKVSGAKNNQLTRISNSLWLSAFKNKTCSTFANYLKAI